MPYTPTVWVNESAPGALDGTPVNATNMNHLEEGVDQAHDAIALLEAADVTLQANIAAGDALAVPKAVVDAAGDLIVGSGPDAVTRLAKGADGTWLSVAGGALVWAAAPAAAASVATSVAGLGAGSAGKMGFLRMGVTPYEFLAVIYDATTGKWVSAPEVAQTIPHGATVTTSTSYVNVNGSAGSITGESGSVLCAPLVWRALDAAGMKPQFRLRAKNFYSGNASHNAWVRIVYEAFDEGGALSAVVAVAEYSTVSVSSSNTFLGDWENIPVSWTVKDMMSPMLQIRNEFGSACAIGNAVLEVRWVSQ